MFFSKKIVGIDVGTSAIKVVEISMRGSRKTLKNYGEIKYVFTQKGPLSNAGMGALPPSNFASKAIEAIFKEAKIRTKKVIFSLPDFSTFCTSFEIPPMPEKEIQGAINYNASQYVTLPISEVALDWQIMPSADKKSSLKVFLVAVPNQLVQQYQEIAKYAGLDLYAIEPEAFSITRALVKNNQKTVCLIDIGEQSSTINIIDKGFLKRSYSFDFSSSKLSVSVSSALHMKLEEFEKIRNKEGIASKNQDLVKALTSFINPLLEEVKNVSGEFTQSEKAEIQEIYLTGGMANLPGLKEYFSQNIKKQAYAPNCFSDFLYPSILQETLREISPRFSAAVGAGLGGLEK